MTRLTAKDLRRLIPTERKKKLEELYNELSNAKVQVAMGGGTSNPYRIRAIRKTIARILTIENEMERTSG
ncbi:MAG: 50S ribosomal protein L29 [Candidatus Thorarchaeota archaeon]